MGVISRRIIRRRIDLSTVGLRSQTLPGDLSPAGGAGGSRGAVLLAAHESVASIEARPAPDSASWSTGVAEAKALIDPDRGALQAFGTAQTLTNAARVRTGIDLSDYAALDVVVTTAESGVILDLTIVIIGTNE